MEAVKVWGKRDMTKLPTDQIIRALHIWEIDLMNRDMPMLTSVAAWLKEARLRLAELEKEKEK